MLFIYLLAAALALTSPHDLVTVVANELGLQTFTLASTNSTEYRDFVKRLCETTKPLIDELISMDANSSYVFAAYKDLSNYFDLMNTLSIIREISISVLTPKCSLDDPLVNEIANALVLSLRLFQRLKMHSSYEPLSWYEAHLELPNLILKIAVTAAHFPTTIAYSASSVISSLNSIFSGLLTDRSLTDCLTGAPASVVLPYCATNRSALIVRVTRISFLAGCILNNVTQVEAVLAKRFHNIFIIQNRSINATSSGFFSDYSYITNSTIPSNGDALSRVVLEAGQFLRLLPGTSFVNDTAISAMREVCLTYSFYGQAPFLYSGASFDTVNGYLFDLWNHGYENYASVFLWLNASLWLLSSSNASTYNAAGPTQKLGQLVLRVLQFPFPGTLLDSVQKNLHTAFVYESIRSSNLQPFIFSSAVVHYPSICRTFIVQPRYALILAFHSRDIAAYQFVGSTNNKGLYTASATEYLYYDYSPENYFNFWNSVDYSSLQGTTVNKNATPHPQQYAYPNANFDGISYYAGIADTSVGTAMFSYAFPPLNISYLKSYLFANNCYTVLLSNVSTMGLPETTIFMTKVPSIIDSLIQVNNNTYAVSSLNYVNPSTAVFGVRYPSGWKYIGFRFLSAVNLTVSIVPRTTTSYSDGGPKGVTVMYLKVSVILTKSGSTEAATTDHLFPPVAYVVLPTLDFADMNLLPHADNPLYYFMNTEAGHYLASNYLMQKRFKPHDREYECISCPMKGFQKILCPLPSIIEMYSFFRSGTINATALTNTFSSIHINGGASILVRTDIDTLLMNITVHPTMAGTAPGETEVTVALDNWKVIALSLQKSLGITKQALASNSYGLTFSVPFTPLSVDSFWVSFQLEIVTEIPDTIRVCGREMEIPIWQPAEPLILETQDIPLGVVVGVPIAAGILLILLLIILLVLWRKGIICPRVAMSEAAGMQSYDYSERRQSYYDLFCSFHISDDLRSISSASLQSKGEEKSSSEDYKSNANRASHASSLCSLNNATLNETSDIAGAPLNNGRLLQNSRHNMEPTTDEKTLRSFRNMPASPVTPLSNISSTHAGNAVYKQ